MPRPSAPPYAYADWVTQLLASLDRSGPVGHEAVGYLQLHGIQVGIRAQSAGARWTPWNRIEIHPRYTELPAGAPYALSLVIHEVRHLQQGWMTALSVYGELDAWQCQFRFLQSVPGRYQEAADRDRIIVQLTALPLGWDRGCCGPRVISCGRTPGMPIGLTCCLCTPSVGSSGSYSRG